MNSFVEINRYIEGFKRLNKKVMILNDTESGEDEKDCDREIIESVITDEHETNNLSNSTKTCAKFDETPTTFCNTSNSFLENLDRNKNNNNIESSKKNKMSEDSTNENLASNLNEDKHHSPKSKCGSVLCEDKEESYSGSSVDPCAAKYDQYISDSTDESKKADHIISNDKTEVNLQTDIKDNNITRHNNGSSFFDNEAFENDAFESIEHQKNHDKNSNTKFNLAHPPRPPLPKSFDKESKDCQSKFLNSETNEEKDNSQLLNAKKLNSSLKKIPPLKPPFPKNVNIKTQTHHHKSVSKTNSAILSVQSSKFLPNEILNSFEKIKKKSKNETKIPARPPPPVPPLKDDVLCVLIALQHIISNDGLTFQEAISLFEKAEYSLKLSKAVTSMLKMIDWSRDCRKGVEYPRMI